MADALKQIGDGGSLMRLKDMSDGSVAVVVAAGASSPRKTSDQLADIGDGTSKKRLRDMGDGTFAEVKFGV